MSRSVVDQASDVGGVVSAARMRERFLRQRANASTDEQREALSDAIGTLEVRFPDLEDLPAGGAEKFARERGHGTGKRSPTHEGRRRPGKPDAAPLERAANKAGSPRPLKGTKSPSSPKGSPRTPATGPRAGGASFRGRGGSTRPAPLERRVRSRGARAYRETGIPSATSSASQIAMSILGGTVGLAAAYLLLTSAERGGVGGKAIPTLLDSAGGFLRRVIAPEDFFGPGLTPTQFAAVENPTGVAATEEASLAAGHLSGKLQPGTKVNGHPLLPRQLGFKK